MIGPRQIAGCVALDDEAERHQLDAVRLQRLDLAAGHRRLLVHAHHAGDVGPVDVGIHQADRVAGARQGGGEVDGDGGLAHSALAGRDRQDATEVRHFGRGRGRGDGGWGRSLPCPLASSAGAAGVDDADLYIRDPGNRLDGLAGVADQGGRVLAGQVERERDVAGVVDGEIMNLVGLREGGEHRGDTILDWVGHTRKIIEALVPQTGRDRERHEHVEHEIAHQVAQDDEGDEYPTAPLEQPLPAQLPALIPQVSEVGSERHRLKA